MNIFDHFRHLNLTDDQKTVIGMIESFLESDQDVFVLKGYAGTGKTTLIRGIADYLRGSGKVFEVMAPTGRAAKILRDKAGTGMTIHRTIYSYRDLVIKKDEEALDENDISFRYLFPVQENSTTGRICIVDESSMISDKEASHELFYFGTGKLLSDLITYMRFGNRNKLILVGDPAQLPPVTDPVSQALDPEYFSERGLKVSGYELKQVVRQVAESLILKNASKFRELLQQEKRPELTIDTNEDEVIKIGVEEVAHLYVKDNPVPRVGNSIVISFSNEQCLRYNQSIRDKYFPGKKKPEPGDVFMILNNNYHSYDTELYNGDLAVVTCISEIVEAQSAPVWVKYRGRKQKTVINMHFREVTIRLPHYDKEIKCKIIEDILDNPSRDLSIDEMKALFVNFRIRFNDLQKLRKERGLPEIKKDSPEYKDLLKKDPYYNAVRVKYGYAVTCHKAQGGEWEHAYVNFNGMVGTTNFHLRWGYTAITRAKMRLFLVNPPDIGIFSVLNINPIGIIGQIPANYMQFGYVPETPYHIKSTHPAKRIKYFEIQKKLEDTMYKIVNVDSKDYQEIYNLANGEFSLRADTYHNGAGIFRDFQTNCHAEDANSLLKILNQPDDFIPELDYNPGNEILSRLYSSMRISCENNEVIITNIEEKPQNYYVLYFLKTSGKFSYIQFYYNNIGKITSAIPKSDQGNNDLKLNNLIISLKQCLERK